MYPFGWRVGLDHGRIEFRRAPKNYRRSDDRVSEEVAKRLTRAVQLDSTEVTIVVHEGRVILEGTVPQRWMKHAIENVAATVWGVEDVENRVRVDSER
jgi:osmotically-inducible protein OsmY